MEDFIEYKNNADNLKINIINLQKKYDELKMCVNCINSDFTGCNKIYCNRHHEEMDYNSKCEHWEMLKYES